MKETTNLYIIIGQRIRALRKDRGINQEHLAFEAGVNRSYMGAIENGRKHASIAILEKIARVLDVPLAEFFTFPKK